VISYGAMRLALTRGYATASTDTGHVSSGSFDSTWALGRPDLVADFGHRGTHVTTVNGKAITRAYYGEPAKYSYYVGCSKGGQQGLKEAQRYPEDFDGLIAGDPANNWTRFYAGSHLWYSMATLKDPQSYIPAAKTAILGKATADACDLIDGIKDGVIDDPRKCKFDPSVLLCKAGQDPNTCFTAKQVQAVRDIQTGVRTPWGELVHPPLVPGAEDGPGGWAAWTTGSAPFTGLHRLAAEDFFRLFMVPGMQHCSGGPGPNTFDMLTALENWVEKGKAPHSVIASHSTAGVVDRTRPLCVYPKVAVYSGTGSTDDAANFKCRTPREERPSGRDHND